MTMPDAGLRELLADCCDSEPWVNRVLELGPHEDGGALLAAADVAWSALDADEWQAVFERSASSVPDDDDDGARAAAAVALALYRERFGRAFVCAEDCETADELLMRVRIRLGLAELAEWRASCEAQRRRTRRLLGARLSQVAEDPPAGG
jgi:hypothetical protein